jgi:hypothetical protein
VFNNLPRFEWELQKNQMGLSLAEPEVPLASDKNSA